MIPFILTKDLILAGEKRPVSIMLPLPCFTVGIGLFAYNKLSNFLKKVAVGLLAASLIRFLHFLFSVLRGCTALANIILVPYFPRFIMPTFIVFRNTSYVLEMG